MKLEKKVDLSVVVAASNNPSALEQCLSSLRGQGQEPDTEIIVVSNYDDGAREMVEKQFPYAKHMSLPAHTTVPELRTRGIEQARGAIVALAEDHCIFDEHWCAAVKKAHQSSHPIVGGSVENANGGRPLDWAVYFYEYGKYMLPNRAGVVDSLPGNNVSYKRSVLENLKQDFRHGFFETFINWKLQAEGFPLYLMPQAIVRYKNCYQFKEAFAQCYHHGRSFAGMRGSSVTPFIRTGLLLGSLILPLLLPLRITWRVMQKGRNIKGLFMSLPYLLIFMSSWSYGELCGYALGVGNSSKKWT